MMTSWAASLPFGQADCVWQLLLQKDWRLGQNHFLNSQGQMTKSVLVCFDKPVEGQELRYIYKTDGEVYKWWDKLL